MSGRNVFVERLSRSVKYEDLYLRAYKTSTELCAGLTLYFEFYNSRRYHSALELAHRGGDVF